MIKLISVKERNNPTPKCHLDYIREQVNKSRYRCVVITYGVPGRTLVRTKEIDVIIPELQEAGYTTALEHSQTGIPILRITW